MNDRRDCHHARTYSGFNHAGPGRISFTQCKDCLQTWPSVVPREVYREPVSKAAAREHKPEGSS